MTEKTLGQILNDNLVVHEELKIGFLSLSKSEIDILEKAAQAVIEAYEVRKWKNIDSAPKDGRRILIKEYCTVFVAGWGYVVDDMYGWVIVNDWYIEHSDNLLWMEPPKV